MTYAFTIGLTFLAGFLVIYAINLVVTDLFERDKEELRRRMQQEMELRQRKAARSSPLLQKDLSDLAEEAWEETAGESKSLRERLREMTDQSGLDLSPDRLLVIAGGTGGIVGLLAMLAMHSVFVGLAAGLVSAVLPFFYVQMKRQQRLNLLRAQLPDAFDLMGRVLRAGQTMSQAIQSVSLEFKAPIAQEFGYCCEQQNLGLAPDFAFRDLARRTGLLEMRVFVLAILVQRQTGGNLTELLEKLATVVRDRYRLKARAQGITAEGRLQAIILLSLPFMIYAVMLVMNNSYALKLLDHPQLLMGCFISMTIGALWIRKIVNFDF
jgi:tight adherence protein B